MSARPAGFRLRWRRDPGETGLRAVGAGPRGFKLFDANGMQFASVNYTRSGGGWYYVVGWAARDLGLVPHVNTADTPVSSPDEAKAQALAFVRARLAEKASKP